MSALTQKVFGPMLPKVEPELLPDSASQFAQNVRLTSGALEPWRLPAPVSGVTLPGSAQIKTIYRYGKDTASKTNYWLQFNTDVNIVRGPIAGDTEERTYWTDGTYPKKTKSSLAGLTAGVGITPASLRMGVPPPGWAGPTGTRTYAPVASVSGTATDPSSTPLTSTYIVTYLSTWDEESAPSLASNIVTWRAGQSVTITLPGAFGGAYSLDRVRVYRSNTGTSRTSFQLAGESVIASATAVDTKGATALGETCPTWDWFPPEDGMIGLTNLGNGMLAGFKGNTVYFCEPEYPYAWPSKYDTPLASQIVGLAAVGQTLVVGTTDGLVLVTTSDPNSISQDSPKGAQACASKRSMVEMMGGVVYASPDGLIFVGPGVTKNLTEDTLSRDEWQAYKPSSIDGYSIDGRYYAFYDNGATKACLIFSFGAEPGLVMCDQYITAGYTEDRLDSLFVVKYSSPTNTLNEWNAGSSMTATWRSKNFRFHSGVLMGAAKVEASAYPVTFQLFADGVLKHTQSVADALPFRLPAGRDYTISYQINSTAKVTGVRIATSIKELGDVTA